MKAEDDSSLDESAASAAERAAAERLASALASHGLDADPESLAVARLLAATRDLPADDVARRRLRRALVAAARTEKSVPRRRLAVVAALLATAAGFLLLALVAPHPARTRPGAALLAEREAEARQALKPLLVASADDSLAAARLERRFDEVQVARLDLWRSQRIEKLLEAEASTARTTTAPSPTPGGRT